jgi:hypothetical protein
VSDQTRQTASRIIRASFGTDTIRVYQAYSNAIADTALRAGAFVEPFKRTRMTWIKPSFCWMVYRSGWARKVGQERVLGIDISRTGFEWALANSCVTAYEPAIHTNAEAWQAQLRSSPVRIQWDPERTIFLQPLETRTIQIGLGSAAVDAYVDDWICSIEDITDVVRRIESLVQRGDIEAARAMLPIERPYPLPEALVHRIGGHRLLT